MITNDFKAYIMSKVFNNATATKSYYVGLRKNGTSNANAEVSGGGYAREACAFGAPANGVIKNSAAISFSESTADWGTITHWGLYDAQTGGNLLMYGSLNSQRTVEAGTIVSIGVGELEITLTDGDA